MSDTKHTISGALAIRLAGAAQNDFSEDPDLYDDLVAEAWNEWTFTVTGKVRCFGTPTSQELEVSILGVHEGDCDASGLLEVVSVKYSEEGGAK